MSSTSSLPRTSPTVQATQFTTRTHLFDTKPPLVFRILASCAFKLSIGEDGSTLIYDYDTKAERTGVATLLGELSRAGLRIRDLQTTQSSLEDIFVGLVSDRR